MDKALGDKIPEFNRKKGGGEGGVGLSGASLGLGDHRTKFEILIIVLVAVVIIGGTEFLLKCFFDFGNGFVHNGRKSSKKPPDYLIFLPGVFS